ncbi:MAG: imidazolonepropionase [Oscillospiraceae bacterium]|nr:imidazolonepropionase [Oscillospiraceae bacterium]
MQKRKYTHLKAAEGLILSMRQDGMTFREIADELGLSMKQMKNWSYRHNSEKRNMLKGIAPKPKGRPRKDGQPPRQDIEKEVYRLRMENKLLRDFLQLTERA